MAVAVEPEAVLPVGTLPWLWANSGGQERCPSSSTRLPLPTASPSTLRPKQQQSGALEVSACPFQQERGCGQEPLPLEATFPVTGSAMRAVPRPPSLPGRLLRGYSFFHEAHSLGAPLEGADRKV